MMKRFLPSCSIVLLLASGLACQKQNSAPSGAPVSAGNLVDERVGIEYVIYFINKPKVDPEKILKEALTADFPEYKKLQVRERPQGDELYVGSSLIENAQENYPPPNGEVLRFFGRGIPPKQAGELEKSNLAFSIFVTVPGNQCLKGLADSGELVYRISEQTGGFVWDSQTREMFSAEKLKEIRSVASPETIDVSDHVTVHAYQNGEYVRAVTLGMSKFGLPDVVVSETTNQNIAQLITLFCQSLVETPVLSTAGIYDLNLNEIQSPSVREVFSELIEANKTKTVKLSLHQGKAEAGDAENRLIELGFERYELADQHAGQAQAIADLMGESGDDPIQYRSENDQELLAVSEKAKQKLPALREHFNNGLEPNESIVVKAPFKTPDDGIEWMWVQVVSWEGDQIKGQLNNDPRHIPDLHSGQTVNVKMDELFDYMHYKPDGSYEGNETAKIIQKRMQEKQ